jgi:hypothetical protein
MSSSNNFTQKLIETPIDLAYKFQTNDVTRKFIQTSQNIGFSPCCIFCSSKDTTSLINDGSFRLCNKCNKQFKSRF